MSILLIGNSHLAALRHALRRDHTRWPLLNDADFFGLPGNGLRQMDLRDGILYPRDKELEGRAIFYNGVPDLPVSGYDRVIVVGGVKFNDALWVTAGVRSVAHPVVDGRAPVSLAFFRAALDHVVQSSTAGHLIRRLAPLATVRYLSEPFPSEEALDDPAAFPNIAACAGLGELAFMADEFNLALGRRLGCEVIAQPAQTLAAPGLTLTRFMHGSLRLNPRASVPHENDVLHGNALYGAEVLDQVEAILTS